MIYGTFRDASASVSTSSTVISNEVSTDRLEYFLKNISTGGQTITLGLGKPAIANTGIVLGVNDVVSWSVSEGYPPMNSEVWAIASAAGGTLSIHERLRG